MNIESLMIYFESTEKEKLFLNPFIYTLFILSHVFIQSLNHQTV